MTLAYLDPGSEPLIGPLEIAVIVGGIVLVLALIFALVKFVKWAWGAGERR